MTSNFLSRAFRLLAMSSMLALAACGGGGGSSGGSSGGGNTVPAPGNLSYSSPQTYSTGTAITALSPTVTGTVTSYSVSPALPAGLSLNTTTGQITGTPTAVSAATDYVITAQNAGGSTTFTLSIAVTQGVPGQSVLTLSFAAKRVSLDWTAATGATSYHLRKDSGGGIEDLAVDLTGTHYDDDIAVHLTDWVNTRYVVKACNDTGCTDSAERALVPANSVDAIGYLKPEVSKPFTFFGNAVALSADGSTLAVGVSQDNSGTSAQDDTSLGGSGAVHVFVRSGGAWVTQAFLKASNAGAGDEFGVSVSLSADGNTLAVGAHNEDGNGIDPDDDSKDGSGAAYLFVRSGTTWTEQAYLKAAVVDGADSFGRSVALSGDGDTLVVGAINEDSLANTIDGDATDNSGISVGAAYVFVRNGTAWSQQAYLKASNSETGDGFGIVVAISGDGQTIAVGAPGEDSNATTVDGDQGDNSANDSGAVYVFHRDSPTTWVQAGYLKASNAEAGDVLGGIFGGLVLGAQQSIALNEDGTTLAAGAFREASGNGQPNDNSAANAGAVYVFTREDGNASAWAQQAYIKAGNPGTQDLFGASVSLSADGDRLVVGAASEDSSAAGVGGTPDDLAGEGAAYLFTRTGTSWAQTNYIKATNPGAGDGFAVSVALSGDGNTLVVGATGEDDPDDSVNGAGAVYVY